MGRCLLGPQLIKTFMFGILLGIAGVFAALHYVPAVDQYRENSIISVALNGGNTEAFYVKIPMDRIMIGAQGQAQALPPGMEWPEDPRFSNVRGELFKLRNSRDAVIGVASRFAFEDPELGSHIDWVLHLPARGSVFVEMRPESVNGTNRVGTLRAGTREFGSLRGQIDERWIADTTGPEDAPAGRIELLMTFVSSEFYEPEEELAE